MLFYVQVSITSSNERILDGVFHFLGTCLSQPSVAPTLVQHFGRQILAEVLPRIKGVYPKRIMRDVAPLLQRMFAQDMEGVPNMVLSILYEVCNDQNLHLLHCAASHLRDDVNSGPPILFRPWSSARILCSLSRGIPFCRTTNMQNVPLMRLVLQLACAQCLLMHLLCRFTNSGTLAGIDVHLIIFSRC